MGVVLKKAPTAKGDTEEFEGVSRIIPIPKSFKGISEQVKLFNNKRIGLQELEKFVKSHITIFNHNDGEDLDEDDEDVAVVSNGHQEESEDDDYDEIDEDDYSLEDEHGLTETGEKITKVTQLQEPQQDDSKIIERDMLR